MTTLCGDTRRCSDGDGVGTDSAPENDTLTPLVLHLLLVLLMIGLVAITVANTFVFAASHLTDTAKQGTTPSR